MLLSIAARGNRFTFAAQNVSWLITEVKRQHLITRLRTDSVYHQCLQGPAASHSFQCFFFLRQYRYTCVLYHNCAIMHHYQELVYQLASNDIQLIHKIVFIIIYSVSLNAPYFFKNLSKMVSTVTQFIMLRNDEKLFFHSFILNLNPRHQESCSQKGFIALYSTEL